MNTDSSSNSKKIPTVNTKETSLWITVCSLFIFLLFSSCDKNRIYEKNIAVDKYEWSSNAVPQFAVEVSDTAILYNLYVNIRHADLYPFQNIWLLVGTQFPDGSRTSRRIEIMLANDEGKWFGEGLGDIWDFRSMIQENAFFTERGTYLFTLEQNMRQDPLPGIMAVGFRIENTGIRRSQTSPPQSK